METANKIKQLKPDQFQIKYLPDHLGLDLINLSNIIFNISRDIDPYGDKEKIQQSVSQISTLSSILEEKSQIVYQITS